MTNNRPPLHLVSDDHDDDLTPALRAIYAAPEGDGYWSALEQRIMDRIARGDSVGTLWYVPTQWMRIGLIAAGFALIVAASLLLRSSAEQRRMAFESVVEPGAGGPTLAIREAPTERGRVTNYITGR